MDRRESMTRLLRRLAVPLVLASVLTGSLGAVALASAPWNGTCGSGELCIFYNRDFDGPLAAMSSSNASYHGETYPANNWGVNDSASSTKNFTAYYVKWRHEIDYGGSQLCLQSGWVASWVGLFNNDAFTSHLVTSNAC